jgi:chitodextrinase
VPIDWEAMSDEELAVEVKAGTTEKKNRDRIAEAPAELLKIQKEVLYAEDIAPDAAWRQPTGAHDAYPLGWTVTHKGTRWVSTLNSSVWEPGVTGWDPITVGAPAPWLQPLGSHDAYSNGDVVTHKGKTWLSTYDYNVWEPGVSGWTEQVPGGGIPAWVQPLGAQDAYPLNAEVTHNGKYWRASVNANVWEPGVYGWMEFTP